MSVSRWSIDASGRGSARATTARTSPTSATGSGDPTRGPTAPRPPSVPPVPSGAPDPLRILVVNAGSSSLKLRLLDESDAVLGSVDLAAPRGEIDRDAVRAVIAGLGGIDAVGHRIVHGGSAFSSAVRLTPEVTARLA